MANFAISYIYQIKDKMSPTIKKITSEVKKQNQMFRKQGEVLTSLVLKENKFARAIQRATAQSQRFNKALHFTADGVMNFAAKAAAIAFPLKQAAAFETSIAKIGKAKGFTKGTQEFEDMQAQVLSLTRTLPKTAVELGSIAEAGAKMGFSGEDLDNFVKMTASASAAFDISAEEAATQIGSISAKMGITTEETRALLDTVNHLGNNLKTTAADVLPVIARVGGTMKAFGFTPQQTAELSAVASTLETSPELAASGLRMMMSRLGNDKRFSGAMLKDPLGTVNKVMETLKKMDPEKRIGAVKDLFGEEAGRFALKFALDVDTKEAAKQALAEGKQVGSMDRELAALMKTSDQKTKIAMNAFNELAINVGNSLLPVFVMVLEAFTGTLHVFSDVAQACPGLVAAIALVVGGFVGLSFAMTATKFVMGPIMPIINFMVGGFRALAIGQKLATLATMAFNLAMRMSPWGLVITGITLVVGALASLTDVFDPVINKAKELWSYLSNFLGLSDEPITMDINSNMQAGDTNSTATIDGQVGVNVTANNATVDSVQTQGKNVAGRAQIGYGDAMTSQ